MYKNFLGIDIGKDKFDVALLHIDKPNKVKTKVFTNNANGFEKLLLWLKNKNIGLLHACMEATGSYGTDLAEYLFNQKFKVSVVNPARIKSFGKVELSRNKTDQADAALIARFAHKIDPKGWKPAPAHVKELQALVGRLEDLYKIERQEKNRLLVTKDSSAVNSINVILEVTEEQIKEIKSKIKKLINNNPDFKNKTDLLNSIPGVAEAIIMNILAYAGNIEDFDNAKQYAAFAGLNPKQHQSGNMRGRTVLSKTGNPTIRKVLYLPAITAKKWNPIVQKFSKNLENAGKSKMCVIGACMRKLLHIIFGVLKTQTKFIYQECA